MARTHEWMAAWLGLVQTAQLSVHHLDRHLQAELGLSLAEKSLLNQLDVADGRLRMADLAERLLMTPAGVTKMVDRLESAGLAGREASPSDRRVTTPVITPKGQKVVREARPLMRRWIEEHFVKFVSDEERQVLQLAMQNVLEGNGWTGQLPKMK